MNDLVIYENQFNSIALRGFTAGELDLLMQIANKALNQGEKIIVIPFLDLKKYILKSGEKLSNDLFAKRIENVNDKLLSLKFKFKDDRKTVQFVLFTTFEIDRELETLTISVNERFAFLLNELTAEFTLFELEEFVHLKSSYAKECYRRLKQWRTEGKWDVSIEEFRRLLDVPVSYKMSDINKVVLSPIVRELSPLFRNLKIEKKKSKRRGNPVERLIFTFDKEIGIQKTQRVESPKDVSADAIPEPKREKPDNKNNKNNKKSRKLKPYGKPENGENGQIWLTDAGLARLKERCESYGLPIGGVIDHYSDRFADYPDAQKNRIRNEKILFKFLDEDAEDLRGTLGWGISTSCVYPMENMSDDYEKAPIRREDDDHPTHNIKNAASYVEPREVPKAYGPYENFYLTDSDYDRFIILCAGKEIPYWYGENKISYIFSHKSSVGYVDAKDYLDEYNNYSVVRIGYVQWKKEHEISKSSSDVDFYHKAIMIIEWGGGIGRTFDAYNDLPEDDKELLSFDWIKKIRSNKSRYEEKKDAYKELLKKAFNESTPVEKLEAMQLSQDTTDSDDKKAKEIEMEAAKGAAAAAETEGGTGK